MEYFTIGKEYNKGKIAHIKCLKNTLIPPTDIKHTCFLLIILTKGTINFEIHNEKNTVASPSFLCFDELENPIFNIDKHTKFTAIYFHPNFLNINMTFELLRSNRYEDIATTHDMFMLKPFINKAYVIPIIDAQVEKIEFCADCVFNELENQRDWYWSCRGRSYFMEIILTLERMYGLIGYGLKYQNTNNSSFISNPKLRDAVLYIESHYSDNISLKNISEYAGLNHTTLTKLMKEDFGCTAMEYLKKHRINVSKKKLAFTDVPIKDIANTVGFKTVQHFNRIFKKHIGISPAEFRKNALKSRKKDFYGNKNQRY